jgi:hypothetical protein
MTKKHPDAAEVQQDESVAEPQSPVADELPSEACEPGVPSAAYDSYTPPAYGEAVPTSYDIAALGTLLAEGAVGHLNQEELTLIRAAVRAFCLQFKGVAEA